ncbi:DUF484 family protein [Zavarzinia compransoris]|uniref:DUF484 domain-containing protein n=1 Tax=Zavarzinia compransoris TaxID=1264899 RepID=A0A317E195_9PROT|nr:DUF484 family protein [Zavarzinia compransoris]PWR20838.1 DUF484 domain-containing protein [Zavarzinia compransoris]TDP44326.1 hypothetical protein DES42_10791 [Zavarzinia compransoris]
MSKTTEQPEDATPETATPEAATPETAAKAEPAPAPARRRLTSTEVRGYLMAHPGFLARNADLLEHQALPPRSDADGDKVVDFQRALVERLRTDNARLRHFQSEVITAARANVSAQGLVQEAILLLLEAASFEEAIHAITQDLAPVLGIDVVTLCLEGEGMEDAPDLPNLQLVVPGTVDALLGEGQAIRLASGAFDDGTLFGPAAPLVQSQAFARLDLGDGPVGLLALGSRDPDKYDEGQGGELLHFLALVVERVIQLWLRLAQA